MQFTLSTVAAIAAFASTAVAGPVAKRSDSYQITIVNQCSETIWPGLGQVSSSPTVVSTADSGFELTSGSSRTVNAPTTWLAGRVFGRTGCTGSGSSLSCQVGDCSGQLSCNQISGVPNVSLAEFSFSDMGMTFYDISLISGYNLGMKIQPTDSACATYDCPNKSCSDSQAYQPAPSTSNPTMGCALTSGYTITFCPS